MPVPLTAFVRPYLVKPAERASLTTPVLVWEAAPNLAPATSDAATVVAGAADARPSAKEPLVLPVSKRNQKLNAFALGVTVGRTDNNDVVIPDESISRFQGYFQLDAKSGRWSFTDAGSTNGSFAGALRLTASRPQLLGERERLRLGFVDLTWFSPAAFFGWVDARLAG